MYFQDRECRSVLEVHNRYILIDWLYAMAEYMDIIRSMSALPKIDHPRLFTF